MVKDNYEVVYLFFEYNKDFFKLVIYFFCEVGMVDSVVVVLWNYLMIELDDGEMVVMLEDYED